MKTKPPSTEASIGRAAGSGTAETSPPMPETSSPIGLPPLPGLLVTMNSSVFRPDANSPSEPSTVTVSTMA